MSLAVVAPKGTCISALAAKGVTALVVLYEVLKAMVTLGGLGGSAVDYSDHLSSGVSSSVSSYGTALQRRPDISAIEITSALDDRRR
jgi:hypothetical protein